MEDSETTIACIPLFETHLPWAVGCTRLLSCHLMNAPDFFVAGKSSV
jgi:hypothetical protein